MTEDIKNVLLLLLRLDPSNPAPLRFNSIDELEFDDQQLLVGILEPTHKKTCTPMTALRLNGKRKSIYNRVLKGVKNISELYYGDERKLGYIDNPHLLTEEKKKEIFEKIISIGEEINKLLSEGGSTLKEWLDNTLESEPKIPKRSDQNVTIITNEFAIPWYWINKGRDDYFLCESCTLGINQLELNPRPTSNRKTKPEKEEEELRKKMETRALFIQGSSDLPFADEEMEIIINTIEGIEPTVRRYSRYGRLMVEKVCSPNDLSKFVQSYDSDGPLIEQFKILHFSGHYSSKNLLIDGNVINTERFLEPIIRKSLLVLDGCSSSRDVTGWTDLGGITSEMINYGAFGCIATILPVKANPIVGDVFWKEFYKNFVLLRNPVGQSLLNARLKLRDYFKSIISKDPTWLFYQLIGSPSTKLFEDEFFYD
jgi:hypothetical protein